MSAWHVDGRTVRDYAAGRLATPECWSLETHVAACARCAETVAGVVSDPALGRIRGAVLNQAQGDGQDEAAPARPPRGGLRLTLTPALQVPWLVGGAGVVLATLVLDLTAVTRLPLVLLVAPLLPLLGIALGSSPAIDRSAELVLSTPTSPLRLLMLRSAAVVAVCLPPLLVVSLLTGTGVAAWLLPAAALVALALALSTRLRVEAASGCAAALWAAVALGPAVLTARLPAALSATAGPVWVAVTVAGAVLLVLRRAKFEDPGVLR